MRWLRRGSWALVAVVLALVVGVVVPRPLFQTPASGPATRQIFLLNNAIHTDIALPIDDELRREFAFLSAAGLPLEHPGVGYIAFGWGGRAFYLETPTWSELKLVPLAKGLTADRSVMHVALTGDLFEADDARALLIGEDAYRALLTYIQSSFTEGSDGDPIFIEGSGYSEYDRFFEANGTFTALLGCNTWTAGGLRAAGVRTGLWNPLPSLLKLSMDLYPPGLTDASESLPAGP